MIFTSSILQWFAENGRDLAWRQTKNPYAIWLSEIILQQTRVVQGEGYWHRFMQRWPTVELLAAASEDEVMREWQGLGYYSRARNLHKAALQIAEFGYFPNTYETIKELKGVGDYTAAAIASFAFGEPVAVLDGNVFRVLARYFGIDTPIDTTLGKKTFREMAQTLIDHQQPDNYNQAIMDFGALQCTPSAPQCTTCPLADTCVAYAENSVKELPKKSKKIKQKIRKLSYVYLRCNGDIVIHKRGAGDIWQGLWEFPSSDYLSAFNWQQKLLAKGVKHVLTHQIIYIDFHLLETTVRPSLPQDFLWVKEEDLANYALPRGLELLLDYL